LARRVNNANIIESIEQKYKDFPQEEDGFLDEEEEEHLDFAGDQITKQGLLPSVNDPRLW